MKKSELTIIGYDYYLSVNQVASLEKCTVQNIYFRIKGKSMMFYSGNAYRVVHIDNIILLVPAKDNRYIIDGLLKRFDNWKD